MHITAMHSHEDVVNSLIKSEADVNVIDSSGNTPLY
jgi:ankyrin repeat protein